MVSHFPNFYPQTTSTRACAELSGFWKIAFDFENKGHSHYAHTVNLPKDARPVGVPSSYNDQFTEKCIRDFVGTAYYYFRLQIPQGTERYNFLRFGSANYHAEVFIEGQSIGKHSGGHLPFTVLVPSEFHGREVLLCVAVDNNLTLETIPPGERNDLTEEKHGVDQPRLRTQFDFFHYSGLNRKVWLLTTPRNYTKDVTVKTTSLTLDSSDLNKASQATLSYQLNLHQSSESEKEFKITILLKNASEEILRLEDVEPEGTLTVESPILWRPGYGHRYTFIVQIWDQDCLVDEARERIGVRTVAIEKNQLLINRQPVYLKGFGRHEDFHILGRYLSEPVLIRDFELMNWIGANSFRTSHYPYSEEHMELADELGILVINETPAVGLREWHVPGSPWFDAGKTNEKTLEEHRNLLTELIRRDKNRPSVIMWSISNENSTADQKSRPYFKSLVETARSLDDRPLTNVLCVQPDKEQCADLFDVICINRYFSWYTESGELDTIPTSLKKDLEAWFSRFQKPLIMAEFGADTIHGFHMLPSMMFSEEFQSEFLEAFHQILSTTDYVIGEHIWNFADFATKQEVHRVIGNRKGVFTRDRQPKMAAHTVRKLWRENS